MAKGLDLFMHRLRTLVDPARLETATDGELLARWALNRDGRAFAGLVGRHGAMVWRVGQSILGQREDAEDVFQATFLVLARKAAALQRRSSIGGWLYQTAYRLAYKSRAATARRLRREDRAQQRAVSDPLEEISVREARTILAQELDRLAAVYREPLLLCLYEGATQDEAARRLGCPLRTLKRRLERGRALLGRRLSQRGLAPASALAVTLCSRAEVPAGLAAKTIAAATQFASGQVISGTAAVLAEGVLRGLMVKKLAVWVTLLLTLGSLTLAGGFAYAPKTPTQMVKKQHLAAPQALARTEASFTNDSGSDEAPRVDPNGDPLPPGAIQRIGSNRLRHGSGVARILYTPDAKAIASISGDGFLYLWDAATGKRRWRIGGVRPLSALAVNGDGTKLAVLCDDEFSLVALDTGKKLTWHQWPKDEDVFAQRCLAIAPDLGTVARGRSNGTVELLDTASGQEKLRIIVGDKAQNQSPWAIEFSADGKVIYVLARQKPEVMAFSTKTGKPVQTLEMPKAVANPYRLALSQDNHLLAAMERGVPLDRIVLWDLNTGKQRWLIEKELSAIICGAFSPDGSLLAIGSQSPDIVLFDTATGKEKLRLHAHPSTVSLAFAPDGKTLATGDIGNITLWDTGTGKRIPPSPEPNGMWAIRFSGTQGKQVLSFGDDIDWWDVTSAKVVRHLAWEKKGYHLYSVSQDGKMLASSSPEGDIVLMDATTGEHVRTLSGHKSRGATTAFSPDGTKLFSAGLFDPRVIIWDVATGKPLHELRSHAIFVERLAVSPNGRWLASAARDAAARGDYDIRLWDVATGNLVHRLTPRRGSAFSMVFSADSSRLVTAGGEPGRPNTAGEVQLWDVASGKEVRAFNGHLDSVMCVAMTADCRLLITGSLDNTLRLWEVVSGKERGRITGHEGYVYAVEFSPNGRMLAAASADAPVYIWDPYALEKPKSPGAKLTKEDQDKLWQALADTDATMGFHAVCELIARPSEAAAIVEGGWQRSPRATPKQMHKWVDDLSSDQFAIRKTATQELERFAAAHDDLLREALQQVGSLEARQRLEKLVGRLDPERLRRSRMLEVLEQLRTAPARQFLQALAEQQEDTAMAREAAAGLKRLAQEK